MLKNNYTPARSAALARWVFPESEWPMGLKILWFKLDHGIDGDSEIITQTHTHSFFEWHVVFDGEISYECGEETVTLKSGDAWLVPPDTAHRYTGNGTFSKASLAFSMDEQYRHVFSENTRHPFPYSPEIAAHIDAILEQSEDCDVFASVRIGNRLLEIFCAICRLLEVPLPTNHREQDSRLLVAKQYIRAHRHLPITCEDVAKECCLSAKQLNRIFQKYTDKTLHAHLVEARIQYAKKLVSQNEYSIKEIAYRMGFKNESCFVTFFKRHFHITPGEFRKHISQL